ncbi:hypothetical protein [Mangrovihabitans endophyticus]|uniref:hypothetical protein n=1 Tax=Mangrovihabitans endophyticus TaxID=1751298 RepID=UPI001E2D169D|nr:hypothetical protein [Mangrovihabitans endophyticus]
MAPDEPVTPDELEHRHTLATATARYDELRMRDALAPLSAEPLTHDETLELLALSEVVVRKIGHGRQTMVHTARTAGASWTEIGDALGTTKQSAWESHRRWSDRRSP